MTLWFSSVHFHTLIVIQVPGSCCQDNAAADWPPPHHVRGGADVRAQSAGLSGVCAASLEKPCWSLECEQPGSPAPVCGSSATCCCCCRLWNFWQFSSATRGNGQLERLFPGSAQRLKRGKLSLTFLPRLQFVCFLLLFFCLQLRCHDFTRRMSYRRAGNFYQHTYLCGVNTK